MSIKIIHFKKRQEMKPGLSIQSKDAVQLNNIEIELYPFFKR
jgi:hypothetical protein